MGNPIACSIEDDGRFDHENRFEQTLQVIKSVPQFYRDNIQGCILKILSSAHADNEFVYFAQDHTHRHYVYVMESCRITCVRRNATGFPCIVYSTLLS